MGKTTLSIRGINYDTGVNYMPGFLSRSVWHSASVQRDMQIIAKELHCNAVTIFGTEISRIHECAEYALAQGLEVWLQPRLVEGSQQQVLQHLMDLAQMAEALRRRHHHVVLNIGCELSLFMKGILPGKNFQVRIAGLMIFWLVMSVFNRKLNRHLKEACRLARIHFKGPLTYSSGVWEKVDWSLFDYVGVDYYRDKWNEKDYINGLRKLYAHGKPVVITEFGCCTFEGAEKKGGGGFMIIDWKSKPAKVKPGYKRDELTQAKYLQELIDIFQAEKVFAAFVYAFSEPSNPHTSNPDTDLDMASYGVVKVLQQPVPHLQEKEQWQPKKSFHTLAEKYSKIDC